MLHTISINDSENYRQNISIDDQEINDVVFDEEQVNYRYTDRVSLIEDIQCWLCEARRANRTSDAYLMDNDIDYLKTLDDEYIFNSISTNEYIAISDNAERFNEICEEILDANLSAVSA